MEVGEAVDGKKGEERGYFRRENMKEKKSAGFLCMLLCVFLCMFVCVTVHKYKIRYVCKR